MERVLRKRRGELILSGISAILLGIWVFVKVILNTLFAGDYLQSVFDLDSLGPELKAITLFLWMLIGFIGMLLYLYVGIHAVREGRTGNPRRGYLVLAAVLLVGNVLIFIENLMAFAGSWRFKLLIGLGNLALGILSLAQINSSKMTVYIYCLGVLWSALGRIVSAFRPASVVYVEQP